MKTSSFSFIISLILLCFVILTSMSCSFSAKKAQQILDESMHETYDMIIVPGIPLKNGVWDSTMKARVYWSKYLFDKGIAKNIMYSGSAVYTPYYEGEVMALYAAAIGIPSDHIFSETKAEHSTENIYYGYHKSKMLGFNKIAVATDPFQGKQLRGFAKKRLDKSVKVIPIVFDTLRTMQSIMTNPVIDYEKAFKKDFVSIKERESFWKRLKGTMSWNLDKNAYK